MSEEKSFKEVTEVTTVWKKGENLVAVEARGFKGSILEPVDRYCDTAPGLNALDYFLASLGACMTTIAHWHAAEAGVTRIDEIAVKLRSEIDFRACAMGDPNIKPGIPEVAVEVTVKSPDDPANIRKAVETAERLCPVSDTIQTSTKLKLVVKSEAGLVVSAEKV